jgi:hypothetical protein
MHANDPVPLADCLADLERQMDPDACLRRAAEALEAGDLQAAQNALDDYQAWLSRGGYEPDGGDARASGLRHRLHQAPNQRPKGECREP